MKKIWGFTTFQAGLKERSSKQQRGKGRGKKGGGKKNCEELGQAGRRGGAVFKIKQRPCLPRLWAGGGRGLVTKKSN